MKQSRSYDFFMRAMLQIYMKNLNNFALYVIPLDIVTEQLRSSFCVVRTLELINVFYQDTKSEKTCA